MDRSLLYRAIYVAVAALFVAHEMEGAYWREWEMFGLPGGVQLYLLIHLVAVAALIWGYERVTAGARSGDVIALLLAVSGIAAFPIHLYYILRGDPGFQLTVSWALIAPMSLLSLALAWLAVVHLRGGTQGEVL